MSVVHQSSVTTVEEPLPTPGNSGAKLFFAVAGLGAGWVSTHTNIQTHTADELDTRRVCTLRWT